MRINSSLLLATLLLGCTTTQTAKRVAEEAVTTTQPTGSSSMRFGATDPAVFAAQAAAEAEQLKRLAKEGSDEAERQCERVRAHVTSLTEERAIGRMLAMKRLGSMGRLASDGGPLNALAARVELVGRTVARFSSRPELPWTFAIIERSEAEASSEPGGYVFVTTGLLKTLKNEAELAGVLAHEVAHVSSKHGLARYKEARRKHCVAATYASYLVSHGTPGLASNPSMINTLKYDDREPPEMEEGMQKFVFDMVVRSANLGEPSDVELATDRAAADMLVAARYDVAAYEQWLSDHKAPLHPPPADRAAKLKAYREKDLARLSAGATAKPALGDLFAPLGK